MDDIVGSLFSLLLLLLLLFLVQLRHSHILTYGDYTWLVNGLVGYEVLLLLLLTVLMSLELANTKMRTYLRSVSTGDYSKHFSQVTLHVLRHILILY